MTIESCHRTFFATPCFYLLVPLVAVSVLTQSANAELVTVTGDTSDGALLSYPNPPHTNGAFTDSNSGSTGVRVGVGGSGGSPNTTNGRRRQNAILFFQLPEIASLNSAELEFSHLSTIGNQAFAFNADLWGLGFVTTPTLDTDHLFFGENDSGSGLGIVNRVKVVDNLISNGSATGVVSADVSAFIDSLYVAGAIGGQDFAVFRLNPDQVVDVTGSTLGFTIALAESVGREPQITLDVVAVPEPSSLALIGTAAIGFAVRRRRSKK